MKLYLRCFFYLFFILVSIGGWAQSSTYSSRKTKYTSTQTKKPTYQVGGTNYIYGETYSTTGKPKVERSYTAKKKFLKRKGYSKVPKGYEVDHIIPLSQGGKDDPGNMQLLTKEEHKRKTARERRYVSATYSKRKKYTTTSTDRRYSRTSYHYRKSPSEKRTRKSTTYRYKAPRTYSRSYRTKTHRYASSKSYRKSYSGRRKKSYY